MFNSYRQVKFYILIARFITTTTASKIMLLTLSSASAYSTSILPAAHKCSTNFSSKQILLNRITFHELKGAIWTKLPKPTAGAIGIKTVVPTHEDSSDQFLAEDDSEIPESRGAHFPPPEVQAINALKDASKWLPNIHFPLKKSKFYSNFNSGILPRATTGSIFNIKYKRNYAAVFFRDESGDDTPKSPDFSSIRRDGGDPIVDESNQSSFASDPRLFTYMVVGASGVLTAMAARAAIIDFLAPLSPSAAAQASSQTELDLAAIPAGKNVVVSWRGKPVFVRHRTEEEIEAMNSVDLSSLRDPQKDSDRVQKPEWLVMLGICTHLGCVPLGDTGDFNGWYCPCQ